MKLSIHAVNSFKELYFKHFNIKLNDEDTNTLGTDLLNFFKLIYRAIPKADDWRVQSVVPVYEIQ